MLMITSHAYDFSLCRRLQHMQMIMVYMQITSTYADDYAICNKLRLSRWLPYNYIDNNGICKPLSNLQMIAWHADDYGIYYAYDHNIIMHMMICEEWKMYGAVTSAIETTEWRRWNINMINTQIRAWLTKAFNWKHVQLSSWLEINAYQLDNNVGWR